MSNSTKMAAELEAIREQLATLTARIDAPSHREQLRERARLDKENPDPMPHSLAEDGQSAPETIQQQIQRYVRSEMMEQYAEQHELGTFEQEDDFTEDDFDALPNSAFEVAEYELEEDPEMPRIEDADDSRAIEPGSPSIPAEPPLQPQQPAASSAAESGASSSNETSA